MRILRLTNSSDILGSIPEPLRAHRVTEQMITELTGEPVETMMRVCWPGPELADIVHRWATRFEPDVVFMRASAFWCSYESVPLRIQRRLARIGGEHLANLGLKVAGAPAFATNPVFRAARRAALRAIGGDVHFQPAEVTANVEAVFRRVLSNESVIPVLRGPGFARDATGTERGLRRAQARNRRLDRALADMARRLGITYASPDAAFRRDHLAGDDAHTNEAGQRAQGEIEGRLIAEAWLAAMAGLPAEYRSNPATHAAR
ncbi:MAG: SGNH/GDSL hydrolase family protein [Chloroflexi bacterium]|nr:SGNH/GDSL hydrolase family protein [Chloroflexota bacterium]